MCDFVGVSVTKQARDAKDQATSGLDKRLTRREV